VPKKKASQILFVMLCHIKRQAEEKSWKTQSFYLISL